jgi:hypothetical protein
MIGRGEGWPCLGGEELRALDRRVDRWLQILALQLLIAPLVAEMRVKTGVLIALI